jgi:hypothetical protein
MDRTEFCRAIHSVGLSTAEFAALIGVAEKTAYDWGGRYPVPYPVRLIITLLQERGGAHGFCGRPPADRLPRVYPLCSASSLDEPA